MRELLTFGCSESTDLVAEKADQVAEKATSVLSSVLFKIGNEPITLGRIIMVAAILMLTLVLAKFFEQLLMRVLRSRKNAGEGEIRAIGRVVGYGVWFVGGGFALSNAGFNLSALFAAGAVFAVALGFAMQNIVENFASGLILLLERAIKPGDVIELDGMMVKVDRMGIRTTVARTLDEEDLVVPNSRLVQSSIKNYTLRDPHYRVRAKVGVAYSSDMALVGRTLIAAATNLPWRSEKPGPRALLIEFGASSVDWELSVWVDDPWSVRRLRSELQLAIWDALKEADIVIAFPQLDVHFDLEALAGLLSASSASSASAGRAMVADADKVRRDSP